MNNIDPIDTYSFVENENSFHLLEPKNSNKNSNESSLESFQSTQIFSMKRKKEKLLKYVSSFLNKSQIIQNINNLENKIKIVNSLISYIQMSNEQNNLEKKCEDSNLDILNEDVELLKNKKFTEKEDEILKKVVFTLGPKNWRLIASFLPGRNQRQCRDRYANYLAPGLKRKEWTDMEDKLIVEKYNLYGPKWAQIRQFLPFRTANDIKNRYNYTISRKININDSKYPSKIANNEQFNKNESNDIEEGFNDFLLDVEFTEINIDQIDEFNHFFINY